MGNVSDVVVPAGNESLDLAPGIGGPNATPFEIGRHNGFVQGYNDGFLEAAQSVELLIWVLGGAYVLQVGAGLLLAFDVKVPVLDRWVKGGSRRVWRFVDEAGWAGSLFFVVLLVWATRFPIGL